MHPDPSQFEMQNGHLNIPAGTMAYGELKLSDWCNIERAAFKKESYPKYRSDALEKIEGWIWDVREEKWNNKFTLLVEYEAEFKHVNLKKKEIYKGVKLGIWLQTQRLKPERLTKERRDKLVKIGVQI